MTVNSPEPDPRTAPGPAPGVPVAPGGTRPDGSGASSRRSTGHSDPGRRENRPGRPPQPSPPTRPRGWAEGPLVAVCALVLLVAAFFLAYALVLML
ncbi:DUF6480 family protein [Streptomyces wuyuanensis]|uniref:Uncharacterized protein n=1 Tax=Streptomyces wuyuanensis TaxID=1196353 RepID=A0A1G9Q7Q1_9ACTN|nr:DUF6480 family protein [Streptomyces wuyuanensis]SDM06395.1 hypothetical protein SAMN05444921_103309 [Streptomyces wuyuanensis]